MCYHAEFGHFTSKGVAKCREPPYWDALGPRPLGGAAIDPLRRQPNLIALGQTVRHKTAFQSHSDRSGTRDFLAYLVVFPSEILTNNFDFFSHQTLF